MRIIDTKILTGDNHPQLKVLDKLYVVDDRKSTFDKIQEVQKDESISEKERDRKVFELALGEKEAKEILELDLSVKEYIYFTYCVMGAITGEDPDKLMNDTNEKK